jgi:large subunit ribosomal protein L13
MGLRLLLKMTKKIILDGKGAVFGRICSFAAKRALEGNEVIIVNAEKVILTGNKKDLIGKFGDLVQKGGHSQKGPKYSKSPYRMLKRGVRGMLPDFRKGQGKIAFDKIKCYNDIPEEFKEEKMIQVQAPKKLKFMELKELSSKI